MWTRAVSWLKATFIGSWQWLVVLTVPPICLYVLWVALNTVVSFVKTANQMHTWVIFAGLAVITLVTPQTVKANELLRMLDQNNVFATFGEAKRKLNLMTWSSIGIFFVLVFCAGSL